MKSFDVRKRFIEFFTSLNHRSVPAAPVCPSEDPTIMFTNAGMNQFKDIFLGSNPKQYRRVVNSQPCIRVSGKHNDLEDVGRDGTHQTLFEMLGNWSFGDYYKKEAISWAWACLTEVFGFPKHKMYATVYETDDESAELWAQVTDISPDHILRFGKKDNFWEMGDIGPCGPCSEIHMDLGDDGTLELAKDPVLGVNGENQRFIEFWNLVFIQSNRLSDGSLVDLDETHVDTGMGLERLTAYMQGVTSNYETDLFQPILRRISDISGVPYVNDDTGIAHRVMADHIRTLLFSISDNVMPGNDGRGYVLRRLLRRALRYASTLSVHEPILYRLIPEVLESMAGYYPHITERADFAAQVIESEEVAFLRTLESGTTRFQVLLDGLADSGESVLSGDAAFKLYDTYGFPLDLTELMASDAGVTVDRDAFQRALDAQQRRSRDAAKKVVYDAVDDTDVSTDTLVESMPDLFHSPHQKVARGGEARIVSAYEDKLAMARHHTATHLLHEALRRRFGTHIHQAGSLVDTDRLRFDFTHFSSLSASDIEQLNADVNEQIAAAIPLSIYHTDLESAKAAGVMALFGEKYDADRVRVVGIGTYSKELCGGTHVINTSMIEGFKILDERSVSAGTRRIEAIAGNILLESYDAKVKDTLLERIHSKRALLEKRLDEVRSHDASFEAPFEDSFDTLDVSTSSISDLRSLEKELTRLSKNIEKKARALNQKQASADVSEMMIAAQSLREYRFLTKRTNQKVPFLKTLADQLVASEPKLICVLAGEASGKGVFVVKLGSLVQEGTLTAPAILSLLTDITGGGGGGRDMMAQAGGADLARVDEALVQLPSLIESMLVP